ncbi:protein gustavus-like [Ischnura elegans]|uniref:protein gustavus-like n=1 Tax=Ischnura elegans TaxID=197161 RepID=UPI001ED86974|nr:protein gustavus-like [Ischnura elegans]
MECRAHFQSHRCRQGTTEEKSDSHLCMVPASLNCDSPQSVSEVPKSPDESFQDSVGAQSLLQRQPLGAVTPSGNPENFHWINCFNINQVAQSVRNIVAERFERILESSVGAIEGPSSTESSSIQSRIMHPWRSISACLKTINMNLEMQPREALTPKELAVEPPNPRRLKLLFGMPEASKEVQLKHAWNPRDCSRNIRVEAEDKLTFHRYPVAQTTDCIRGKVGFSEGLHVWEIVWPTSQRGTHAVVGVATADAPLYTDTYVSLVGLNEESWGWDLGRNILYHDSKNNPGVPYPSLLSPDESFMVPDKFKVILDMDEGTLAFMVDSWYLGVAFRNLKGRKLYPIVSAVWGRCEVSLRYIGGLEPAKTLMDMCRWVIRGSLGHEHLEERVNQLALPHSIKAYLLHTSSMSS